MCRGSSYWRALTSSSQKSYFLPHTEYPLHSLNPQSFGYVAALQAYGTNHPQLKQSTRATRVLSSCHTRVFFVAWDAVYLHTRVGTRVYTRTKFYTCICLHAHKAFSYTCLGVLFVLVSHSMYILQSKRICFVSVVPLFFLGGYLQHCYAVSRAT